MWLNETAVCLPAWQPDDRSTRSSSRLQTNFLCLHFCLFDSQYCISPSRKALVVKEAHLAYNRARTTSRPRFPSTPLTSLGGVRRMDGGSPFPRKRAANFRPITSPSSRWCASVSVYSRHCGKGSTWTGKAMKVLIHVRKIASLYH